MKILLYSDIHLKFQAEPFSVSNDIKKQADIVIVLGDISENIESIDWAAREFKDNKVLFVAGDHEFYGREFADTQLLLNNRSFDYQNITFLNDSSIDIDGFHFHGGTMWTNFRENLRDASSSKKFAQKYLEDFKKIKYDNKLITPENMCFLHNCFKFWLQQAIVGDGKDIVLTHFAPLKRLTIDRYVGSQFNPYFNPDVRELAKQVPVWMFGHTHACWDEEINGTRFISNCLGYTRDMSLPEDPAFEIHKIITL